MKNKNIILFLAVTAMLGALVTKNFNATPRPQPAFPVGELRIEASNAQHRFSIELATTPAQQHYGLMFRKHMADDHGMLFLFDAAQTVSMWMKNTYIPLDMIFIANNGTIKGIAKNTTPLSTNVISSPKGTAAVLELNAGTADRFRIQTGDRVIHRAFQTDK